MGLDFFQIFMAFSKNLNFNIWFFHDSIFYYFLSLADAKETQSKSKKASAAPDDKINDSLNETLNTQQTPTTSSQASLDSKSSGKDLFTNGRIALHDFIFFKSLWVSLIRANVHPRWPIFLKPEIIDI